MNNVFMHRYARSSAWRKTRFGKQSGNASKLLFGFASTSFFLFLLRAQLKDIEFALVRDALTEVSLGQWIAALGATSLSFWAIGQYDLIAHRHFRTGLDAKTARNSGAAAVAVSQCLGLGIITGTLARYRGAEIDLKTSGQITVFVTLSFLFCHCFVLLTSSLIFSGPIPFSVAFLGLVIGSITCGIFFFTPSISIASRRIRFPSLPAMANLMMLTGIDLFAAAATLHILLPLDLGFTLGTAFVAYTLALGLALVSGAPGGVGPFEFVIFMQFPLHADHELLAGILAFRVIYYAFPATIALGYLSRKRRLKSTRFQMLTPTSDRTIMRSIHPELAVARQTSCASITTFKDNIAHNAVVATTPQTLTLLFAPTQGEIGHLLTPLKLAANLRNAIPCMYKIDARNAAVARRQGWVVRRVAKDGIVTPQNFQLEGPEKRQLRRERRKAETAGVRVEIAKSILPLAEMEQISNQWTIARNGERGFSMGRYDPSYVCSQIVALAWSGDKLVGFATFHHTRRDMCLDLLRTDQKAPTGTNHLIVYNAILHAQAIGIDRFSLAAVPDLPKWINVFQRVFNRRNNSNLLRFKTAFAPVWEPRYFASPTPIGALVGAADIAREIHSPTPLTQNIHNKDEIYEIASTRVL